MRQTKCPKQWRTGSQRALAARAAKKYISGSIAPGCAEGGRIGVPHEYVADTVVCPRCRQVVRVRDDDRVL
jgi:hypothetical protein